MRLCLLACLVAITACFSVPAKAFEIEMEEVFQGAWDTHELSILSTTDLSSFQPIIEAFQNENPDVTIRYVVTSSSEVFSAIHTEQANFDLVISSAMDLQIKLANDGLAAGYSSVYTDSLPDWAKWNSEVFAFAREPAVLVISKSAFNGIPIPQTRSELIIHLRDNPNQFAGKIGTYDVRQSGLGYLFATQDSRHSEIYWRLTETFGRLDTRLYCCSSDMIADIENGRLALAYNVLGSYANNELRSNGSNAQIIEFEDFSTAMLRTAIIPKYAGNAAIAGRMIDFLISLYERPELAERSGFPAISNNVGDDITSTNQIRLGPSLLVFLDARKKQIFLEAWSTTMEPALSHTTPE